MVLYYSISNTTVETMLPSSWCLPKSLRSFLSPTSIHLSKMHRDGANGAMDLLPAGFTSFLLQCCNSVLNWCLCWDWGQMALCSVTPASFRIRMRDKGCSVLTPESRNRPRYKKILYQAVYSSGFMTGFPFHAHHQELHGVELRTTTTTKHKIIS